MLINHGVDMKHEIMQFFHLPIQVKKESGDVERESVLRTSLLGGHALHSYLTNPLETTSLNTKTSCNI